MANEVAQKADVNVDLAPTTPLPKGEQSMDAPGVSDRLLKARLEKALSDVKRLEGERDEYKRQFDLMVHSLSWRVTAPLRGLSKAARAIFPLLGQRKYVATPIALRSLTLQGDHYVINGPTPTFDLKFQNNDVEESGLKPGFYSFEAGVETPKGRLCFFLYLGRRNGAVKGFSETERFLLSFDSNRTRPQLIQIPHGIHDLQLQVYDFDGQFSISDVSIRHLGSLNLVSILFGNTIRPLLADPRLLLAKLRKAFYCVREGGIVALKAKLFGSRVTDNYHEWVARFDSFSEADNERIRTAADKLERKPKISVVTPVFNPPIDHFRACIDSVLNQGYQNWELCLADDCSTDPEVRKTIEEYCARDTRIKAVFRDSSGHISAATNSALTLATGDYVAFLDHDDELTRDALYLVAQELNDHPGAKLIYSDEDKKTSHGSRVNPHFKSDWNPELLLQQNYVCHLLVIKKSEIEKVGGLRAGFDGAQDWDLILRVSGNLSEDEIRHIPHVLYHWTLLPSSTAQSTSAKPYVLEAQRRAVQEHLDRTGQPGKASIWHAISHISVERSVPMKSPKVSLVILTRDKVSLLKQCIESLFQRTTYKNFEVVVIDNGSIEEETFKYFDSLKKRSNVKIVRDDRPFNFSALNNVGVQHCTGEVLGFLNNDLEFTSSSWLEKMVAQAMRREVGAVGARLLFPNNLLQHGGVILGIGGVAGHNHKGRPKEDPGYFNRAILSQNLSAVTAACILMRREVFEQIKGFDELLSVAFNDVDLCLRIRKEGYKIVYEPQAELYHHESASRGYENTPEKFARFEREVDFMKARWGRALQSDPYYNPNLTNLSEDFVLAYPPRLKRRWSL
jgi:glycosyltransferase involved in cell wall biosynthesis